MNVAPVLNPRSGLRIVMLSVPAVVKSAAGIVASSSVALSTVVTSAVPFHCATAPFSNPVPVTVMTVSGSPTIAKFGETDEMVGMSVTTNERAGVELPPPGAGFVTVTLAVFGEARKPS